jgi:hypothetical protein
LANEKMKTIAAASSKEAVPGSRLNEPRDDVEEGGKYLEAGGVTT